MEGNRISGPARGTYLDWHQSTIALPAFTAPAFSRPECFLRRFVFEKTYDRCHDFALADEFDSFECLSIRSTLTEFPKFIPRNHTLFEVVPILVCITKWKGGGFDVEQVFCFRLTDSQLFRQVFGASQDSFQ
jgi:hypothetical protein